MVHRQHGGQLSVFPRQASPFWPGDREKGKPARDYVAQRTGTEHGESRSRSGNYGTRAAPL